MYDWASGDIKMAGVHWPASITNQWAPESAKKSCLKTDFIYIKQRITEDNEPCCTQIYTHEHLHIHIHTRQSRHEGVLKCVTITGSENM